MSFVQYITIDQNAAGQRIDNFLLAFFERKIPKSLIYRKLRKGEVRVNKKRIDQTYRLEIGDEVRIPPVQIDQSSTSEAKPLPTQWMAKLENAILYEDESVIVFDKPSGLAVHGGSGVNIGLIEIARHMRPDCKFLELAHRLDRETSGCILIAKKRQVLLDLHEQLRDKTMRKVYHMLVIGQWPKQINKIDAPLKKNTLKSGERMVQVNRAEGKPSVTTFQVLKKFPDATLMAAMPQTGRTHQIRVHAQTAGHPIVGDGKYAPREASQALMKKYGQKRLCLHAYQLTFSLPGMAKPITVMAESPFDSCN